MVTSCTLQNYLHNFMQYAYPDTLVAVIVVVIAPEVSSSSIYHVYIILSIY